MALVLAVVLFSAMAGVQFVRLAAANPSTQWIKDIGSFFFGRGHSVIQTADGGYAITGGKDGGFLLLKTNSFSDVQWEKTYGTEAEFESFASDIVQAEDGGYVLAGEGTPWPNFFGPNGTLFNLLKTDSAGNVQWSRNYSTEDTPFIAMSIIKTKDGGYAIAGYAEKGHTPISSGTGYVVLIKADGTGNMQWKKQFNASPIYAQVGVISVVETDDAGYAILTTADFSIQAVPAIDNADFWLIKTDTNGNKQWDKNYGGASVDIPEAFIKTADGGYLLAGWTQSFGAGQWDGWLVKTDSEGNVLWNKTYGGNGEDYISSVVESHDGGYVVAMRIEASPSGALIFKIDTSGNTEWTVEYQDENQPALRPRHIIETADGAYVFTGYRIKMNYSEPHSAVLVKFTSPSAIPEFPDEEPPTTPPTEPSTEPPPDDSTGLDPTSLIIAAPIVLAIILGVVVYRRKRLTASKTP